MKRMQRLGGKMLKRSADQADVGSIIAEFKVTDERLELLIKDVKAWKTGWEEVLKYQSDASEAFVTLYRPVEPTNSPETRHVPAETPAKFLQKCSALAKVNADLKADLAQEVELINNNILRPLEMAKLHMKHMHKTLKHRENMKLDYERYLGKAEHARKKDARTAKDEATLVKYESDLAQSQIDYQMADDQVKQSFPPVVDAVLSLFPYILAIQINLQTNMVGQFYTVLDAYCRQYGLPSPAPSDAEIVQKWEGEFMSFKMEMEGGLQIIARGKALHKPMTLPPEKDKSSITGLGIRNKVLNRNQDTQPIPVRPAASSRQNSPAYGAPLAIQAAEEEEAAPPKPPRPGAIPSYGSASPGNSVSGRSYGSPSSAPYDRQPTAIHPQYPKQGSTWGEGDATPPSRYLTPQNGHSPAALADPATSSGYFATQNRRPSASSLASSAASMAAGKKKPPPPVPVKRMPSAQTQFVTALYDFEGQNAGDLPFREGDRIRVVKKTESTDDWWDGELRGRTGAFPANYVQL